MCMPLQATFRAMVDVCLHDHLDNAAPNAALELLMDATASQIEPHVSEIIHGLHSQSMQTRRASAALLSAPRGSPRGGVALEVGPQSYLLVLVESGCSHIWRIAMSRYEPTFVCC